MKKIEAVRQRNGRVLTCKDFTPFKTRVAASSLAIKICNNHGLEQTLIYECATCNEYHVAEEKSYEVGH